MVNEFHAELTSLRRVSVSPDESRAILQYRDQIAELWDMKHNRRLRLLADYTGFAQSRLSPDGESLVQVYYTLIKIWDVPSRSLRQLVFGEEQNFRGTVAISPDSRRFAVGLPWGGTEVRDIDTGELLVRLPEIENWSAFAFNQRGDRIAASHNRGDPMVVFDVDRPHRQQLLETEETTGRPVMPYIAFSRDDRYLAAVDSSNQIHVWEQEGPVYSYRYVWRPPFYISDIAFHPRSASPILAGAGDAVVVWQLGEQTAEELYRIAGSGPVHFSADGRYLFLNGSDGLEIWNWRANVPLEHPPIPAYLDVNKDGSVLATEDESWQVRIWNISALLLPKPVLLGQAKKAALLPNFPNPFNPETWIPYQLSELTTVRIRIHDVSGRQVRSLNLGAKPAGDYFSRSKAAYWDGHNDAGETVSSGLCFYTLEAGEFTGTRRMLIQR